jgi:hypothetical protein
MKGALQRAKLKGTGLQCPRCGAPIRFSRLHLLAAYLLAFLASLLISQYLGLRAYAAPAWIPIFVFCFGLAARLTASLHSPLEVDTGTTTKRNGGLERNLLLFLSFWFASIVRSLVLRACSWLVRISLWRIAWRHS